MTRAGDQGLLTGAAGVQRRAQHRPGGPRSHQHRPCPRERAAAVAGARGPEFFPARGGEDLDEDKLYLSRFRRKGQTMTVGALIAVGAGFCAVLTLLSLDLLGIRQLRAGRRWQGFGILLTMAGILVSLVAEARGSSLSRLRGVHAAVLPVVLAGVLVLVVGLGIQMRSAVRTAKER